MTHISGFERSQLLLLPEAVDDYVGPDNPVRFIDAFVDGLNLAKAGFTRVAAKAMGRPGYAPGDLLKLYIYGYLNRVRSSRRLEAECHRNVEVIWLLQFAARAQHSRHGQNDGGCQGLRGARFTPFAAKDGPWSLPTRPGAATCEIPGLNLKNRARAGGQSSFQCARVVSTRSA
jgi:hypothetical protein